MSENPDTPVHTIIAGYGLPGRMAAEVLRNQGVSHCVIELNPNTVDRCAKIGTPIISGDVGDPEVLKRAGIEHAERLLILIPDEKAALQATEQARQLNPNLRIITRCHYISAGMEAKAKGADEVIVAEQVVAAEISRRLSENNSAVAQP